MIVLFVILAAISLYGVKFSSYNESYISMESTSAIKGIFAVLILYSHLRGYVTISDSVWDWPYSVILDKIGQLMVAMYFFYSGYGIVESAKKKQGYFKSFFKNRVLKTLLHFDIAVVCFLVVMTVMGYRYPLVNYLTCFIGATSVGNSNWFIFVILVLYMLTLAISGLTYGRIDRVFAGCVTALSMLFWIVLRQYAPGNWWYDTLMTFPLGIWYSLFRNDIEKMMHRSYVSLFFLIGSALLFCVWYHLFGVDIYGVCSCLFCIVVVLATSKICVGNDALHWLGTHAFSIYIMQRLPMNILSQFNLPIYAFTVITIVLVLVIAWGYDGILKYIDNLIFA